MSKKVLIITNYYPPEMGAAANRIQTLAEALLANGYAVTVLCPLPNYPFGTIIDGYPKKGPHNEQINGVHLVRLSTYATTSTNPFKRFKAMAIFAKNVKSYLKQNSLPQRVIIQCPPLLVAYWALKVLNKKNVHTTVNISDLWPLAAVELGAMGKGIVYQWMLKMEAYIYTHATLLLGQSDEILTHIATQAPTAELLRYRNYPQLKPQATSPAPEGKVKLIYAGLLGAAQGILELCQGLELPENWELHIYGNGNQGQALTSYLQGSSKRIHYHGTVSKTALHGIISDFNLALVPLKTRIYGSVPSKIFELAHFGIPVIYLGSGEAGVIIEQHQLGWVAPAMDFNALNQLLSQLDSNLDSWPSPAKIKAIAALEFNPNAQIQELINRLN